MYRPGIVAYSLIVALLAAVSMIALDAMLQPPAPPLKKVLIVGDGEVERWSSFNAGALAAAREFGLDVSFGAPKSGSSCEDQSTFVRDLDLSPYEGVALCPVDPESQGELVNDLAGKTKLVTVGRDSEKSRRLCNIGFCEESTGRMVAHLLHGDLPAGSKVALLYSADLTNADIRERLEGFREAWAEWNLNNSAKGIVLVQVPIVAGQSTTTSHDLASILDDSQLAAIIAFDSQASDLAADALSQPTRPRQLSVIAFEPNTKVLEAIDSERVSFALYDDPYRQGYEAVERLAQYCHGDNTALPLPGYGSNPLLGEVVNKDNLKDFRRRTGWSPESASYAASAKRKTSTQRLDFGILVPKTLGDVFHLPFVASTLE